MVAKDCLDGLFDDLVEAFSPDTSQRIVKLQATSEMQARVAFLAEKANDGALTAEEDEEYKKIVDAVDFIGILQRKAHMALAKNGR